MPCFAGHTSLVDVVVEIDPCDLEDNEVGLIDVAEDTFCVGLIVCEKYSNEFYGQTGQSSCYNCYTQENSLLCSLFSLVF